MQNSPMYYTGIWSPNGPNMKIEIDETDCDEIADIAERMHNQTDAEICGATVAYLLSPGRQEAFNRRKSLYPKPELVVDNA